MEPTVTTLYLICCTVPHPALAAGGRTVQCSGLTHTAANCQNVVHRHTASTVVFYRALAPLWELLLDGVRNQRKSLGRCRYQRNKRGPPPATRVDPELCHFSKFTTSCFTHRGVLAAGQRGRPLEKIVVVGESRCSGVRAHHNAHQLLLQSDARYGKNESARCGQVVSIRRPDEKLSI